VVPTAASSDPWLGIPLPLLFHHDARRRANRRMTPRSSCPSFPFPSMKCPNRKLSEHSLTQNLKRCSQAALDRRPGVPPAPHIGIRKRTGRADMRPKDTKDRDLGNFDNSPNFNWRSIFLFVAYTSVVLGFFLFSRNGNYRSVDGPAPRLSYDERNREPAPIPPSERSLQTIVARPCFKVSNGGLQLEGPAFDREGHLLFLEIFGGSSISLGRKN
jgi:hypothetical protein